MHFHLLEFAGKENKRPTVAVIPDSWLIPNTNQCYWPSGGDLSWVKIGKKPGDSWKTYEYTRFLKSAATYERIKALEQAALEKMDIESSSDSASTQTSGKRKRTSIKRWSATPTDDGDQWEHRSRSVTPKSRSRSRSPVTESPHRRHSHSMMPPPVFVSDLEDRHHGVQSHRQSSYRLPSALPAPPRPSEHRRLNEWSPSSSSSGSGIVASLMPFFEKIFKKQDEISSENRLILRCLDKLEKAVRTGEIKTPSVAGALPEEFTFPLEEVEILNQLEDALKRDIEMKKRLTRYLADLGGSGPEKCVRLIGRTLMKARLSVQYNLTGSKGKRSMDTQLPTLMGAIYEAVKLRNETLTVDLFRRLFAKWLTGSCDRDGMKAQRAEKKRIEEKN